MVSGGEAPLEDVFVWSFDCILSTCMKYFVCKDCLEVNVINFCCMFEEVLCKENAKDPAAKPPFHGVKSNTCSVWFWFLTKYFV
jgi:hypothetical protein